MPIPLNTTLSTTDILVALHSLSRPSFRSCAPPSAFSLVCFCVDVCLLLLVSGQNKSYQMERKRKENVGYGSVG